jgi:hypothetical protein
VNISKSNGHQKNAIKYLPYAQINEKYERTGMTATREFHTFLTVASTYIIRTKLYTNL